MIHGEHARVLVPIHHRRYEILRKHLRGLRRQSGLTQAELGARLKIDQSSISKFERGERYMDVLFYLDWCRACMQAPETSLDELIQAGA
jgi:transcriptional regulator with XRE-family HTH domain